MSWQRGPGIVEFPDGRRVRGRGLRHPSAAEPAPEFGVYLLAAMPNAEQWPTRWVKWRDFWLPVDGRQLVAALLEAHQRAGEGVRVEIACGGGLGRTGTALACLAQFSGVPAAEAVGWVRQHYRPGAVETPWQRRFVLRFPELAPDLGSL